MQLCAVCGRPLDSIGAPGQATEWIHTVDLVDEPDHIAVPVDPDHIEAQLRCDP